MKRLLSTIALFLCCSIVASGAGTRRPNMLFILVDDQSPFDFKMYNPTSTLDTPVLDRIASEGVVFDGAYHMGSFKGAVCTPSRYMIMSGRTLWHLPITSRNSGQKKMCPDDILEWTMGAVFNRAGYDTMRTSKAGNTYKQAGAKFTINIESKKRGNTDETGSAWHAQQVLDYLDKRKETQDRDPFFIYLGFSHPHDPRNGKPALLRKYGATNHDDKNSLPPLNPENPAPDVPINYLPVHPFDHGHVNVRDEQRVSGVWKNRDEATIRNETGREYACSENIDIQIGKVVDKLKAMGELDNTCIFYTSDHGIAIGRHGLMGKQNLYEHTWRVPYIVKGPGVEKGIRAMGNIYLLDTLRTMCELAGIETPESTEGISFVPVLKGEKDTVRDVLYGTYCGGSKPGMRSVRKGDWKLIKYDVKDGTVRVNQLFNLAENPNELLQEHHDPEVVAVTGNKPKPVQVNLANDPQYAEKLREMEECLLAEQNRLDDPYRFWNQPAE